MFSHQIRKIKIFTGLIICAVFMVFAPKDVVAQSVKIVIIRHAEKPANGNNLSCQGFNRSLLLPAAIVAKVGVPNYIYVPSPNHSDEVKRTRMFQTVSPLAVKYNKSINTAFEVDDAKKLAKAVLAQKGTVLLCWEHHEIQNILEALGVKAKKLKWNDGDYDSMYIITYVKGKAILKLDRENLQPKTTCSF